MGLSVAIAGAIVLSVLMLVMMTMTGFVGTMFSIGGVTTQISEVEKSIAKTDISLDALEAQTGSALVNFTLNNDDTEKLWNFDNFNVFIEYENATNTFVEELSFNGDCSGIAPSAGNWCIESIGADFLDEGIINDGESADIWTQVNKELDSVNPFVTVSTDNGVVAKLPDTKNSWIDAAPAPSITCEVGNYGRTFIDTDTGLTYVCDPSRDKWLSIETIALWGEDTQTCDAGDNATNNEACNVDWGNGLGGTIGGGSTEEGLYVPYNFTIIAAGFSVDDTECTGGGSFDLEFLGTGSNAVDEPITLEQDIVTGLSSIQVYNDNNLNIDIDGDQYTVWGIENNCSGGNSDIDDWNMIIYLKWRHDNP